MEVWTQLDGKKQKLGKENHYELISDLIVKSPSVEENI